MQCNVEYTSDLNTIKKAGTVYGLYALKTNLTLVGVGSHLDVLKQYIANRVLNNDILIDNETNLNDIRKFSKTIDDRTISLKKECLPFTIKDKVLVIKSDKYPSKRLIKNIYMALKNIATVDEMKKLDVKITLGDWNYTKSLQAIVKNDPTKLLEKIDEYNSETAGVIKKSMLGTLGKITLGAMGTVAGLSVLFTRWLMRTNVGKGFNELPTPMKYALAGAFTMYMLKIKRQKEEIKEGLEHQYGTGIPTSYMMAANHIRGN